MAASDPPQLSYEDQVRYEVRRLRASGCCTDCLTSILAHPELRPMFEEDGEDGPIFAGELHAQQYGKLFSTYSESGAAWLHILGSVSGRTHPGLPIGVDFEPKPVSEAAVIQMIDTLRSHHQEIDFAAAISQLPPDVADALAPITRILLEKDVLAPSKVLDWAWVIELGKHGEFHYPQDVRSPKRLEWWLAHHHWQVLPKFLSTFRAQSDDKIAALAYGITRALENFRSVAHICVGEDDREIELWRNRHRVPAALSETLAPYLMELLSRWDRLEKDDHFVWMCWRFAGWVYGENPVGLDPAVRRRLKERASEELGRLRVLARQADTAEAKEKFQRRCGAFGYYDDLVTYVGTFGSIWEALKPLLLAMRALNQPGVAPDLRSWSEPPLDPVPVWSWIPSVAAGVLHAYAAEEEQHDPRLEDLREEFSTFCLERLKTGKEGGPLEPSPIWRYGCIRALRDLRVNPRGRGHHILHHTRRNDPDATVRAAAEEAYNALRHGEQLPENRSPRRAILGALWWLRRAHFIELRGEAALDEPGALRTRNRESRRTPEKEV
jgi:hypothetical protein